MSGVGAILFVLAVWNGGTGTITSQPMQSLAACERTATEVVARASERLRAVVAWCAPVTP